MCQMKKINLILLMISGGKKETLSKGDSPKTIDASKDILSEIQEISDNFLRNLRPVDNRTEEEKIDDQFIPIDDRTQQEPKDDDYFSLESEKESDIEIENIDTTNAWDPKKPTAAKPGAVMNLSTDYIKKKVANKINKKYLRKKIGQREKSNKISADWLKATGYLDTKDQDKINYIFVPSKKEDKNNIPGDAGHFVRTEIDSRDFKKENLTSKTRKSKKTRKWYEPAKKEDLPKTGNNYADTINILDDIASLQPGKNAQIEAKKISEKYKKMREALAVKKKYKIPGEIVKVEDVKTDQGTIKVPVSIEKPKKSGKVAAKLIIEKYDKIRWEKKFKKIVEAKEKKKENKNINILEEVKNFMIKKTRE